MQTSAVFLSDRVNFKELEVFVAVCELGSISAAGKRFGLSQSAVSQLVQRLEARINTQLIDRSVRPLRVTADGNSLLKRARNLLREIRGFVREFGQTAQRPKVDLRIGLVESLTVPLVPQLVSSMAGTLGQIFVQAGGTIEQREAFIEHKLDIIITSDPLEDIPGTEAFSIVTDPFVLLVNRKISKTSLVKDLHHLSDKYPMVCFSPQSANGRAVSAQLRRMRLQIRSAFEFDAPDSIVGAVATGLGWAAITSLSLLRSWHYLGDVEMLPFPGPAFSRHLFLVARQNEFGLLPEELSNVVCRILRDNYLPQIFSQAPWLKNQLIIGR